LTDPPLASPAAAALVSLSTFLFLLLSIFSVSSVLPASYGKESFVSFSPGTLNLCALLFSTVIHKFAQIFLRNFIDAENGKVYLPPQIEPEA